MIPNLCGGGLTDFLRWLKYILNRKPYFRILNEYFSFVFLRS